MSADGTVLIVDDELSVRDIISRGLERQGFYCRAAGSAREALAMAEGQPSELVISDIRMPGRDGIWLLKQLKNHWPDTAVIMLTGVSDARTAVDCLRMGADDYMIKPIDLVELGISVRRNIEKVRLIRQNRRYQHSLEETVEERTAKLHQALIAIKDTYQSTLEALVAALDAREHETGCHSQRVMLFTVELARRLGIPEEKIAGMARGALLHDIGKIGILDSILLKPSGLNEQEWTQMRRHPEIGYQILKGIPFLEDARDIVLNHQERWDGLGYPQGLECEQTPQGARLFAVVDAFDAMTSDRPYRAALPYSVAREEIRRCAGTQLDRQAVESFLLVPEEVWIRLRQATSQARSECFPLIRSLSPCWALMRERAR